MNTLLTLVALTTLGQSAPQAAVRFGDGSLLFCAIEQTAIEIRTKYGTLTIPVSDIRSIEFGSHFEHEDAIRANLAALGADNHATREKASKILLSAGPAVYPLLLEAAASPDMETKQRAGQLARALQEQYPSEKLKQSPEDTITTDTLRVSGLITSPTLKVRSRHLGTLDLGLHHLASVTFTRSTEVSVDAAKEDWQDTGINLSMGTRVVVSADGQVDLWPQGPGQYMATAKGSTNAGKSGSFAAGALVGRVGERQILMSERWSGHAEGRLYLRVEPSTWNTPAAGTYRVKIRLGE